MISIIIPTLNEESYLPELLDSIKRQDFEDYEIVVADAGSEDKTAEIAEKRGCEVVEGGLPAEGRNRGAEEAEGDLFLFLDADMILPQGFLKDASRKFKKFNLDIATFPIIVKEKKFDKIGYKIYNWWVRATEKFLPHAAQVIMVKKEIHEKIGGFDPEIKIAEDHIYAREAQKIGKFGWIKTNPVLTSSRRFEKEGRLKIALKYLLAELYMIFLGPIKSDIFKYRFNYTDKEKKD